MSDLAEITTCYSMTWERRSKHPVDRLWRAITEPDEVGQWMSNPARIDLRVGGDYFVDFSRTNSGALDGIIIRLEPRVRIAYVWGLCVIEWTLEPSAAGCRYTFVHHGQAPGLVPQEEGLATGWHLWLDDFAAHLEGIAPSPVDPEREKALNSPYKERIDAILQSG